MYLAYSLLLTLGLLVLIPHFIYQAIAHRKYVDGLSQRLGSLKDIQPSSRPVIWLHCVSVGETQAARPLVKKLRAVFPHHALVVSTITATGQKLAHQVFAGDADSIFYFPFDWRWTVRRALNAVSPEIVLIMETELWPNFLRECNSRSIPVALVNGRISRQSFRRYRLVRIFLRKILSHLTMAVMQSESDAERIESLGVDRTKLFTAGNLKFDVGTVATSAEGTKELQQRFGISQDVALILAASTHSPEEKIVIEAFQQLRQNQKVRLMIAPRRPERFNEVARLLDDSGLRWVRRTSPQQATDSDADVILLDTIGELPSVYTLATVVFVGGSIVDRGGHNVLEPASKGACVITGYHTHNFQAIVQLLNEADAIVQLPPVDIARAPGCLERELRSLLIDHELRIRLGHDAKKLVENNQGAADRTVEIIKPLFTRSGDDCLKEEALLAAKFQP